MMTDREVRYYVSIPKVFFLLVVCCIPLYLGLQTLRAGGHVIVSLFLVGASGLGALIALQTLAFAIILRRPLLAIDATGITATQPFKPWKKTFALWSDVIRIGIHTRRTGSTGSFSTSAFEVEARKIYHYSVPLYRPLPEHTYVTPEGAEVNAPLNQRLPDVDALMSGPIHSTPGHGGVSAPLNYIFFWANRKRRAELLKRIEQTFAPEILRYGVVVDEAERVV